MSKKKLSLPQVIILSFAGLFCIAIILVLLPHIPEINASNLPYTIDSPAIPEPVVPCIEDNATGYRNPEFHSLRPYQASPCGDSPKAFFCNNDYKIVEDVNTQWDSYSGRCSGPPFVCVPEPNTINGDYIIGGPNGREYAISLNKVKYPFLGNTENVRNSENSTDEFGSAQKMNEYVNWYLQGVIEKAEYGDTIIPENDPERLAGPVKKLVPLDLLNFRRLEVLHDAGVKEMYTTDPGEFQGDPTLMDPITFQIKETFNHNQIAVCEEDGLSFPCYSGNGLKASGIKRLITWWEQKGSVPKDSYLTPKFANWTIFDTWHKATPPFPWLFKDGMMYLKAYREWRGDVCAVLNGTLYCVNTGFLVAPACDSFAITVCQELNIFPPAALYCNTQKKEISSACQQAAEVVGGYIGNIDPDLFCNTLVGTILGATGFKIFGSLAVPICKLVFTTTVGLFPPVAASRSILADLYRFVPLGNAVDKNAKHFVSGVQVRPTGGTLAELLDYTIVKMPVLHYPHTESTVQVSKLLNQVHTPLECDENNENCSKLAGIGTKYEPTTCNFVDVLTNPGDRLTFMYPMTYLDIDDVMTVVTQVECSNQGQIYDFVYNCGNDTHDPCETVKGCKLASCNYTCGPLPSYCINWPTCKGQVIIKIPTTPRIPYINQIWKETVVGKNTALRTIFPKIEKDAPIECIKEIPATSAVTYITNNETNLEGISTAGPNFYGGGGKSSASSGQLFFPHLGTIYEYFLKGIQTALRPKGMGSPIPQGELCPTNLACGELPTLPPASSACALKSTSVDDTGAEIPDSFAQILGAAAETYHVPAQLIVGVMFGEGVFNGGTYHGGGDSWSEENVIAWASCQPLPNCTDPTTSIVDLGNIGWDNLITDVLKDLKEIDPKKTEVDPCNLLDATFVLAKNLHDNALYHSLSGKSCFGITMNSTNPQDCSWDEHQYETAIRVWEFGTAYNSTYQCATKLNSCAEGGGVAANCPEGDNNPECEQIDQRLPQISHNGCVWDVAHGL